MFDSIHRFFNREAESNGAPLGPKTASGSAPLRRNGSLRQQTFAKIFRWRLPAGQTPAPASVEVVGTFTQWQKVPLERTQELHAWQVIFGEIQGNRTHRYMLLVDGKPVPDEQCDGLAVPQSPEEELYQVMTEKGPRVMMLFAQTK